MTTIQKQSILFRFDLLPLTGVDGIWGAQSEQATKRLQEKLGLEPDGVWGIHTCAAVNKALGITQEPEKTGTFWDEIEYFTREEFACKCGLYHAPYCDGYPAEPKEKLVRIADELRRRLGVPVTIVSGLRCRQHNADSKGVATSQHMYGEAADVYAAGIAPAVVEATLDAIGGVRYHYHIQGSQNVHFDIPMGER